MSSTATTVVSNKPSLKGLTAKNYAKVKPHQHAVSLTHYKLILKPYVCICVTYQGITRSCQTSRGLIQLLFGRRPPTSNSGGLLQFKRV